MATSRLSSVPRPSSSSPSLSPSPSASTSASTSPSPSPRLKHPDLARPRTPFCWSCSRPLQGWMHRKCIVHGNPVVAHVRCARTDGLELAPGEPERLSPALCRIARKDPRQADEIIQCACRGDRLAVSTIAAVWGPMLEGNVRSILDGLPGHETDFVVDQFFDTLLTGRNRFTPAHGQGVAWMRVIVRAMARVHRARLAMNAW